MEFPLPQTPPPCRGRGFRPESFTAGESICTELSHKYTRETATRLLEEGGFRVERWETDATPQFAMEIARVA